ncbi:sigma-54-dependent Fis family transcriptional regulator [Halanaerobium praevalens]|uniref:PAS modulated sigma54 specific transcriptional regulator, Fis family n=1 Tax=Halanaerobium praevalens (strain ATCC 33744 / DSM 2228 / GSL) TaxID=572479 RepID=E3DM83_HALPG|nr:sigma-54-dependent Fis family transcriptional regulator [Halanaerobium praevalens]ADO76276.1 PAS modulated sigma54 specific transcriptional regulator, Fis family [Halanaerobium praevalens DSM 2228]
MNLNDFNSKKDVFEWLESIIDSIHNCIIAINKQGKIILVNKASEKLLGFSKKELLDTDIKSVVPESKLLEVLNKEIKLISQRLTLSINKKEIYTHRTPLIYKGEITGALAVFEELSDIDRIKNELTSTKNDLNVLNTILNEAYEAIVIVNKEGYITKFNKAYEEFLGLKEKDVIGKYVADIIENTRMHKIINTGKKEIGCIQKIEGNEMICSRIPIFENGEIIGGIGKVLFKDVKELKILTKRIKGLESKLNHYKNKVKKLEEAKYSFDNILTINKNMNYIKKIAKDASSSNSTVLIQGESGTGKELFAHAIHKSSHRKYGPLIRVNCAAIPKNLLESELFGYEEGSFTGASRGGKAGKFEIAQGGTIFLDEIGSMPKEMQAKLLRVLQEKEVQRIGSNHLIDLDVRVIAATNERIEEEVKNGDFRKDLFYRLNVIRLNIPPLRDRKDDIPLLAKSIISKLAKELDLKHKKLSDETIKKLKDYDWPGNVRELRNFMERCLNYNSGDTILPKHLPSIISDNINSRKERTIEFENNNLSEVVQQVEIDVIINALKKCNGNKTEAAKILGIHRTSLYKKIDKYNLNIN